MERKENHAVGVKVVYPKELSVSLIESYKGGQTGDGWLCVKVECPASLLPFLSFGGVGERERGRPTGRVYSPEKWLDSGGNEIGKTKKKFYNPVLEYLRQAHAAHELFTDMELSGFPTHLTYAFLPPYATIPVTLAGTLDSWRGWCRKLLEDKSFKEKGGEVFAHFSTEIQAYIDRAKNAQ